MNKKIITDKKKIKLIKPIGSPDDSRELLKVVFWFKEKRDMNTWTKDQKEDLDNRFSNLEQRIDERLQQKPEWFKAFEKKNDERWNKNDERWEQQLEFNKNHKH